MALNDGSGAFETARSEEKSGPGIYDLRLGDLTGDGQDEIATEEYREDWEITVWSIEPELQMEVLTQIQGRRLVDVVDWDGDGRVELFTADLRVEEARALEVWEVEQGEWTVSPRWRSPKTIRPRGWATLPAMGSWRCCGHRGGRRGEARRAGGW